MLGHTSQGRPLPSLKVNNLLRGFGVSAGAAALFFACAIEADLAAQSANDAGRIEQRIQRQIPEERQSSTPLPAAPTVDAAASVQTEVTFTLVGVDITGSTIFQVAEFAPIYEALLGKTIGPADLEKIATAITQRYRDAGYFLSRAVVPAQDVSVGLVEIQVIEGYVETATLEGDMPGRAGLLRAHLDKIQREKPLTRATLERQLLLLGDISGLSASPSLSEIEEGSGRFELIVQLTHDPFGAFASLDNRGTATVGPLQLFGSVTADSALGLLERTQFSAFTVPDEPDESQFFRLYHQVPIDANGTYLWASASISNIDYYSESRAAQLEGRSRRFSVGGWHPIVRGRKWSLYANGQFDVLNSKQEATGDNYDDRTRVVRLSVRNWFVDPLGGPNNIVLEISKGLDILNASDAGRGPLSRAGGETTFRKAVLDIRRVQKLLSDFWMQIDARGQISPDELLSSEEIGIGGGRFGRGYDPSEISDSDGVAAAIELRHRLPFDQAPWGNFWVYGFYDWGAVWRTAGTRDSLASTGGGIRLVGWKGLLADLQIARPLTRNVFEEGGKGVRVFFRLSGNF